MNPSLPHATSPARRHAGRSVSRGRAAARLAAAALAVPLLAAGCGSGGGTLGTSAPQSQMDFGVEMAQRGLWSEALFRFQQAQRLAPGDPQVLNNLAVAYEATGQYEKALTSYQQALQAAPSNRDLRRNYARFVEFYQSYRPQEEAPETADGGAQPAPGAGE